MEGAISGFPPLIRRSPLDPMNPSIQPSRQSPSPPSSTHYIIACLRDQFERRRQVAAICRDPRTSQKGHEHGRTNKVTFEVVYQRDKYKL